MNKPAMFWIADENSMPICELFHHKCKIPEGNLGFCGVRKNIGGELYAMSYGYGIDYPFMLDSIEKKPLYMFHPEKCVLSIGSFGCNLRCPFCQNCNISMEYSYTNERKGKCYSPESIASFAKATVAQGNIGVAYTYNEPFIGYEFIYDCAKLVREAELFNIIVTNGCINREPLENILPLVDAMNIDLKSFSADFYGKIGGSLEAVKETIKLASKSCHIEVTTLVIPGENDSDEEITELAKWLASVNPAIPLHLSRFFPRYKYWDKQPTTRETIYRLSEIAGNYLGNVFMGNMG